VGTREPFADPSGFINVPDGADNPAPDTMIILLAQASAFLKSEISDEGGIIVKVLGGIGWR
jgi:hypothetical protein